MQPKQPSSFVKISKLVLFLLLLALPFILWFKRFDIYDWWRLRTYSPPPEIAALAEQTTMSSSTKRIFYANHPEFADGAKLRESCHQDEVTIVLGCYVSGRGIYLFDVNDERLNGVEEVTAAHEMLHAAYDRLSKKERERVDGLTAKAYAQVTNQRVKDTVEQYRQRDPGIVSNELHSILATEIRDLPLELEEYYKQYFTERGKVVGFSEQYEGEFSSRQAQVKSYDQQLASLQKQIDENQAKLASQSEAIKRERAQLDALLAAEDYSNYNGKVDSFNIQVNAYNRLADTTTRLIDQYNGLVNERNALALEVNDLAKAIDTRPQGISNQQ